MSYQMCLCSLIDYSHQCEQAWCKTNTPRKFVARKEPYGAIWVTLIHNSAPLSCSTPCFYIKLERNFMVHSIQLHFTTFVFLSLVFLCFIPLKSYLDKEIKVACWASRHHRDILISHRNGSQPGDSQALWFQCTNYRIAQCSWSVVGYSYSLLKLFL